MTVRELLTYIESVKPHVFPDSALLLWLNELEGRVQTDIFLAGPGQLDEEYTLPEDENTVLLVDLPHTGIYRYWLEAMIDFESGEYNQYQNSVELFNNAWNEFACWFAETQGTEGDGVSRGFYLSAYGIAVKHGYEGTEEEWLETLKGAPGEDFKYEDFTEEQLAALREGVVQNTLDQARSYAQSAEENARAAEASKTDAGAAATAAEESARAAEASKTTAEEAATAAEASKTTAEEAATAAEASETNAKAAAALAEEAKGEAESFMESASESEKRVGNQVRLAEQYKNEAVSARTSARNAANAADVAAEAAETAQAAAEKARDEAVEAAGNAGGGIGGKTDHDKLENRDAEDQHPMSAITGLEEALEGKQPTGDYALRKELPSVPVKSVNGKTGEVELGAKDVGADAEGAAAKEVSGHNTSDAAHSDIRLLITNLTTRLNALANSEDVDLDQMAELVAYIKDNRELIEQITTGKVGVNDIVNNLTTNTANKPLSAAQGVALKALIDAITVPTKVSQLINDKGYLTEYTETDPTVPAWAKATTKPSYSKSEVGLGSVADERQYSDNNPPPYPVTSVNGQTGAVEVDVPAVVQATGESTTDVMSQKAVTEKLSQLSEEKVDQVPDYWADELSTKASEIQTAMELAGRKKSAFLWYTDAHWPNGNSKVSPKLLKYLYEHTPMNKVNFGGDIIGDSLLATRADMEYLYEWRKAIKGLPNHHSVAGNHDNFTLDTVDYEDENYRYAFLLAPEETNDMVIGDGNYYYIDNHAEKTRYLYFDYIPSGQTAMMAQGQFMVDAIKGVSDGWHIVAINHRWWQYSKSATPTVGSIPPFETDMLSVFDAYNARTTRNGSNYFYAQDFTNAKGKVEFCIGGHIHVDYDFETAGGIPVIITTADTNQNRVPDSTVDSGTVGTTTEAAVFGIVADYTDATNPKINVIGVGRGTSRVVRKSGVKPVSISNLTYSGDTTVGATIDKSKFSFTVNYNNGTTDTVNGATSVSPATIGVVGDNAVAITYAEGTVTLTGTVTIVGTPVPVVNLLNLDRTFVSGTSGETLGASHLDESKAYLNVANGTNVFGANPCTVSAVTEDSITYTESGSGGYCVCYLVHLPDIKTQGYKLSFDYTSNGSTRVYNRYVTDAGVISAGTQILNATGTNHADLDIPKAESKYSGEFTWLLLYFSANTGKTVTLTNVVLTKAE